MADWQTNFYLANRSNDLADAMLTMLNVTTGQPANVPGVGDPANGEAAVRDSLIADAEYFMSMDPERLEQEFDSQVRAANLTLDADARASVRLVQDVLDPNVWHGTAAELFHKQMTHIETFMDQQSSQALLAAQAAGMMFSVSVQYRESFYDLVDKTIAVCNAKIAERAAEATNWKSVTLDIIGAVKNLVTGKTAADLLNWSVDQILSATKSFTDKPAPDGAPAEIVDGYLNARNSLTQSYESNLGNIKSWLESRCGDIEQLKLPLLEPLPVSADVDSPDFRYENFSYHEPVPGVDNGSVERERTRYAQEKAKPDGLIGVRLAGTP
jgi:hypothetical protein